MKVRILYKPSRSETFVSVAQFLVLICFYEGVSASVLRLSGQGRLLPVFHLYAPDSHSGTDSLPITHACLHSHTHTPMHACTVSLSHTHTPLPFWARQWDTTRVPSFLGSVLQNLFFGLLPALFSDCMLLALHWYLFLLASAAWQSSSPKYLATGVGMESRGLHILPEGLITQISGPYTQSFSLSSSLVKPGNVHW